METRKLSAIFFTGKTTSGLGAAVLFRKPPKWVILKRRCQRSFKKRHFPLALPNVESSQRQPLEPLPRAVEMMGQSSERKWAGLSGKSQRILCQNLNPQPLLRLQRGLPWPPSVLAAVPFGAAPPPSSPGLPPGCSRLGCGKDPPVLLGPQGVTSLSAFQFPRVGAGRGPGWL